MNEEEQNRIIFEGMATLEAENRSMRAAIKIAVDNAILSVNFRDGSLDHYDVPKADIYRLANFLK